MTDVAATEITEAIEKTEMTDNTVIIEDTLSTQQIQDMIKQLSVTEEGEDLRNAMQDLKKALKANPAACAALLPEDIGQLVHHLKKLTGKDVEEAASKKKGTKKKDKIDISNMTSEQQQEILDDLF